MFAEGVGIRRVTSCQLKGLPIGRGVRLREYYRLIRLIPGEYNVVILFLRVAGMEVRSGGYREMA
jgi:hypothetical protein